MPDIKPMIIGIWCGVSKPSCLTAFLQPLVDEINEIVWTDVHINGYRIEIAIRCCICDAPARAFLKGSFNDLETLYSIQWKFIVACI